MMVGGEKERESERKRQGGIKEWETEIHKE